MAPRLTPFPQRAADGLAGHLRWLFGVPDGVPLTLRDEAPQRDELLRLTADVGAEHPVSLRLVEATASAALWRGEKFAVEQAGAATAGDQAWSRAIVRRLQWAASQPQFAELIDHLGQWRQVRRVPLGEWATVSDRELLLRLLFRCNQDCDFCWQDRQWPAMPVDWAVAWIGEAAAAGCTQLTLSGGEPTLHLQLPDLIAQGRRLGMTVTLQTNGIRLGQSASLAERLAAIGLQTAVISLHSADADLSDRLTRAPRTHAKTLAGARACLAAGIAVVFNCVVDRRTVAGLPALAETIASLQRELALPFGRLSASFSHPNAAFDAQAALANLLPLGEAALPVSAAVRYLNGRGVFATAGGNCGFPLCALRDCLPYVPRQRPHAPSRGRASAEACGRCAVATSCVGPRSDYLAALGESGLQPFDGEPADWGREVPVAAAGWWA